jgi:hypothetical protein
MDRAMQRLVSSTKRVKAGNGQAAAAARRNVFVQAYIANGHNATQAAITAGYSTKTAYSQGQRLLKHVEISGQLADVAQKIGEIAGLTANFTVICTPLMIQTWLAYAFASRCQRERHAPILRVSSASSCPSHIVHLHNVCTLWPRNDKAPLSGSRATQRVLATA